MKPIYDVMILWFWIYESRYKSCCLGFTILKPRVWGLGLRDTSRFKSYDLLVRAYGLRVTV